MHLPCQTKWRCRIRGGCCFTWGGSQRGEEPVSPWSWGHPALPWDEAQGKLSHELFPAWEPQGGILPQSKISLHRGFFFSFATQMHVVSQIFGSCDVCSSFHLFPSCFQAQRETMLFADCSCLGIIPSSRETLLLVPT